MPPNQAQPPRSPSQGGKGPTRDPRADFRVFLALLWKALNLPPPTPVQLEIAWYLQHGPDRRCVEAFRGVGKSWETSAYVVWRLWNDQNLRCLVLSASKDRSDAFSTFTKRLLRDVPFLRHLAPVAQDGDRDSNIAFDVHGAPAAHAPSVKSVGVFGQMTGSRADLIVFDDAEVPNNSETAVMREKLLRRVTEGGAAVLSPGGEVVFLGTPQTEDSLYNKLPDMGYEIRVWPARLPADVTPYAGRLAPSVIAMLERGDAPGTCVEPSRFGEEELTARELEYGRAQFRLQYMLDTSLADIDRYPLKLSDFIVTNVDPEVAPVRIVWGSAPEQHILHLPNPGFQGDRWHRPMFRADEFAPYETALMYIDPSGRGADETGYAVVKTLHGKAFITAWGGEQNGYDEVTLTRLALVARDQKVKLVVIEDNFGDGMWSALFIPVLNRVYPGGCKVDPDTVRGAKEERIIDRIGPALGAHKLVIDEELIKRDMRSKEGLGVDAVLKSGLHQLTRITRERGCLKHDDRIEALGGAVFMALKMLGRDSEKAAQRTKSEAFQKELRKFAEHVFKGGRPGHPRPKAWGDRL